MAVPRRKSRTQLRMITAVGALAVLTGVGASASDTDGRERQIRQKYKQATMWGLRAAPEIEASEALALAERDAAVFVDVRSDAERQVSTIPGAIVPGQLAAALELDPDRQIIVYCTIGARSATFTNRLKRQGIDARNLVGGVLAWANAGGGFEREGSATTSVHVNGPSFNILPEGFKAVW
jgi:rhodanese-related sulfurtransferase